MGFTLLFLIVILDSQFEEFLKVLNRVVVVVGRNFLLDQRNLLIAFRLLVFVICALSNVEALFKEGQRKVKLILILVLDSN